MKLDLQRFFDSCNPSKTLVLENPEERQYYIDFASVRGGKVIEALGRTITRLAPNKPTCQLFTGHIGCGKSTELRRLEAELKQQNFHVVYFESTQDLDMADVDVTDIMLAIARQVSESLEAVNIKVRPGYFTGLLNEIIDFLQTPIELKAEAELSLPLKIAKITAKTKDSPKLRSQLRQYLEPRTNSILESINQEVVELAQQQLKAKGKNGLVVIIDNLDRVDPRAKTTERSQPEYLFVDRGEQLRKLNCHVVYTIPLVLMFSNEIEALKNRLGGGMAPKILPMVPVQLRDGRDYEEGLALLRQMVLARAFPGVNADSRLALITEIFDTPETLNRLCRISGGHVRNLLGILYSCLQVEDPPLSRESLENAIREYREGLVLAITDDEWDALRLVVQKQSVSGEVNYQTLLRSLFVFEYQDQQGRWFGINPVLAEAKQFQL
ncbi:KAP family P-loop domain-containing protein [Nostoc sp. RF31YmG]|nr:KAP family P-loop domain-containing protein [Nostoc sp. RF31YmG]